MVSVGAPLSVEYLPCDYDRIILLTDAEKRRGSGTTVSENFYCCCCCGQTGAEWAHEYAVTTS